MGDHFAAASQQAAWGSACGRLARTERHLLHSADPGSPWRDLPKRYGPYTTVYNRFNRWAKAGVWLRIFEALAAESLQSLHLIDSSIVRAHQHAAGGKKGARITPSAVLVED